MDWEKRLADAASTSGKLFEAASGVLAGGMSHDMRFMRPHPIAFERASGPRKWDVDGNPYVDCMLGHGALLLGHSHPQIVEAVREQVARGTHFSGAHPSELEWAELVCSLVPSADRVRFTSSGTEAVLLAARIARAFTGRDTILKFHLHFHGWSEIGLVGLAEPFDAPVAGNLREPGVVAISHRDEDALHKHLSDGDIAAVILEPSGSFFGQVPLAASFLPMLRDLTASSGTLLVFDEVVTGFRWAPGGVQELCGVVPDLTTLAKILGGGLPAGALAGRAEIMELFDVRPDPEWNRFRHVPHLGTFNANPLSAAAGIATLRLVATGEPTARADDLARELRSRLNGALEHAGVPGIVYGESSTFHVSIGTPPPTRPLTRPPEPGRMRRDAAAALRTAMLSRGVDMLGSAGMLSSAHGPREIDQIAAAFEASVDELAGAGALQ